MNVIFLDFDGVLVTHHFKSLDDIERRIKILADICHRYDCKVVIESSAKTGIDEKTLEVSKNSFANCVSKLFEKYGIECIGRTPNVERQLEDGRYYSMWKEDEIIKYLEMHPEIEHYCVIDDDDAKEIHWKVSDLDKVRNHLIEVIDYSNNPEEEGLLPKHIEEVGRIIKKQKSYR